MISPKSVALGQAPATQFKLSVHECPYSDGKSQKVKSAINVIFFNDTNK